MAIAHSDSDDVMSEINVTPLVDVMLVLVVVFLVTAPLLTNIIRVNLPQTSKTAPSALEKNRQVNLSLDQAGKVFLDKREIAMSAVEPELKQLHTQDNGVVVHLNADKGVTYGWVAKAMSAVDRAGITHLSVLTVNE